MTAPLWAALLSLIVALIQPFQHALDAHMQPVKGALTMAGNCSIPVTLIVLGAYFYAEPQQPSDDTQHADAADALRRAQAGGANDVGVLKRVWGRVKAVIPGRQLGPGQERKRGETKTVFVSVVSRMVVTPILLLPLIAVSTLTDWHSVFEE